MPSFARAWQLFRKLDAIQGSLTSDAAKLLLWPMGSAVVTLMSGLVAAVPLPYLLAAASLVFATVATGLLRLDEWRERASPAGRLMFTHPVFNMDVEAGSAGRLIKNVQLGIALRNEASFPLRYRLEYIDTRFLDRVAVENTDRKDNLEIGAKSASRFRDNIIKLDMLTTEDILVGRVKFKVTFWKHPKKTFTSEHTIRVVAKYNPSSQRYDHTWSHQ